MVPLAEAARASDDRNVSVAPFAAAMCGLTNSGANFDVIHRGHGAPLDEEARSRTISSPATNTQELVARSTPAQYRRTYSSMSLNTRYSHTASTHKKSARYMRRLWIDDLDEIYIVRSALQLGRAISALANEGHLHS